MPISADSSGINMGPQGGLTGGSGLFNSPLLKSPAFQVAQKVISLGGSGGSGSDPTAGATNAISGGAPSTSGGDQWAGSDPSMGSSGYNLDSITRTYNKRLGNYGINGQSQNGIG